MTAVKFARFILCAALALTAWAQPPGASPGSYLGVWIWEVDAARAKELKLPEPGGVEVTLVRPGSPAEAAGIKPGDVVAEYNGQRVEGIEQFSRLVRETPVGRPAKLRVLRNGASVMLNARIETISAAERPGPVAFPRVPVPPAERLDVPRSLMTWRNPVLGIEGEPLFGQLAGYFAVTEGVLVRSVAAGSVAEKAGLRAGDVIVRVGKQSVATPAEVTARLRTADSPTVRLTVMRERAEVAITVTLE